MTSTTSVASKDGRFEAATAIVLQHLRSHLGAVIGCLPDAGQIRRPTDLQRRLQIDSKLAWQLHRMVYSSDGFADGGGIPKSVSLMRFLEAAERQKVSMAVIEQAKRAIDEFDALIAAHAGDHDVFETMLSGLRDGGSDQLDLVHRRSAFRAQSHILGVQSRTWQACCILNMSEKSPDLVDAVTIRGRTNLRRFRSTSPLVIDRIRTMDNDGVSRRALAREPLDPINGEPDGPAFLHEFCSQPLPKTRRVSAPMGVTNLEFEAESVGSRMAITYFVGETYRSAYSRYRDEHNLVQDFQVGVRMPCEVMIGDVLVRAGLYEDAQPQLVVFSDHACCNTVTMGRECDLLPFRGSIAYLGRGPAVMQTPEVPRYGEMMAYAFDRLQWPGDEFDVYRCRIEYPVMPSSVVMRFALPDDPQRAVQQ